MSRPLTFNSIVQCNIFSELTDGLYCCVLFNLPAWFTLKDQKVGGKNSAASAGKSYHFYMAWISLVFLINFMKVCIFVLYNSFRERYLSAASCQLMLYCPVVSSSPSSCSLIDRCQTAAATATIKVPHAVWIQTQLKQIKSKVYSVFVFIYHSQNKVSIREMSCTIW